MKKYDLVVIGSGPGGEKAAVKAAYFGYKVAVVEKAPQVGGAGIHTGTLPSKTLKETALYLSGKKDKGIYGIDKEFSRAASVEDFMFRKNFVSSSEADEMCLNLERHGVDVYRGFGRFEDKNTVLVTGNKEVKLASEYFIVATGSYPYHPSNIPFDGHRVHDSDTILDITSFPESLCVVGAGVIGCEYATIFATMGTRVYLVNHSDKILGFLDGEMSRALVSDMEKNGVEILFNTSMEGVQVPENPKDLLRIPLKTGDVLNVDSFLYAAGRCGSTKGLALENVGLRPGEREVMEVNDHYQTEVPNIYAIGDCIGFPALASTSMDQGRVAVANIFGTGDTDKLPDVFPYGIYTVPEVSCVGMSEEEAQEQGLDYCTGRARYADLPRGKIIGLKSGFLKIVFTRDDLIIRGVHIIGKVASELIHYGCTIVENKKTVNYVVSSIFNYPTLHDLYKYACYDGLGNLTGHKVKN
ncbi:Probable soluble pyridine nucleotide transhydrogenase [Chlamydiales bacterium SCGC AG-110-P3]|nr:Probable soluble pyridine nucleotide transhydrogenase [Chlamydiales bacterium SCGC AG-110-P3]